MKGKLWLLVTGMQQSQLNAILLLFDCKLFRKHYFKLIAHLHV